MRLFHFAVPAFGLVIAAACLFLGASATPAYGGGYGYQSCQYVDNNGIEFPGYCSPVCGFCRAGGNSQTQDGCNNVL